MPRSPTPSSHRMIVNAANVLPSVDSLISQGSNRQRTYSQPMSPGSNPYPSTRGSSMEVDGEGDSSSRSPPNSPLSGHRSPQQARIHSPRPRASSTDVATEDQPMVPRWVHTTNAAYPNATRTPPPVELPVIPNRMGGRYAQTPHHPNGQPHAPDFMPRKQGEGPSKVKKTRQPPQLNPAQGILGPVSPPPNEMRKALASQEFQRSMAAAGNPTCGPCVGDIKRASLRKAVAQIGPGYVQYAHGLRPQLPTQLPPLEGLTRIPFTPKPLASTPIQMGVSLSEIMDFCDVLDNPDTPVLEPIRLIDGSMGKIYLIMEHPGYPRVMKELEGNCVHRPATRFSLAYSVAEAYSNYFTTNDFSLRGPAPSNTIVVRSFVNMRLVNLFSTDGVTYRAHVAYVF
ncbi:hypothetical protein MIND_01224900 [Mycena indigotica]|uniref:Uncharacterized protein n=1 Tax=Mycena indigotica TaxID=2126181 RepID=A0A8H6VS54_9AGAR|nr:uncharacterized protein MIND_01224900 [Mycena indigotica]KAF7291992.1 hypothetical protein MIND_01224900 [Mycena indigotica]